MGGESPGPEWAQDQAKGMGLSIRETKCQIDIGAFSA